MKKTENFFSVSGNAVKTFPSGKKAAAGGHKVSRYLKKLAVIGAVAVASRSRKGDSIKKAFETSLAGQTPIEQVVSNEMHRGIKIVGTAEQLARLRDITDGLAKCPWGQELLTSAGKDKYALRLNDNMPGLVGVCFPNQKLVVFNPQFTNDRLIGTAAHELKHAFQFKTDVKGDMNAYAVFMQGRALESDATATQCFIAYQLKDSLPGVWKEVKSSKFFEARALEAAIAQNPTDTLAFMEACAKGWFKNKDYVTGYDKSYADGIQFSVTQNPKGHSTVTSRDLFSNYCTIGGKTYMRTELDSLGNKSYSHLSDSVYLKLEKAFGAKQDTSINQFHIYNAKKQFISKDDIVREPPPAFFTSPMLQTILKIPGR